MRVFAAAAAVAASALALGLPWAPHVGGTSGSPAAVDAGSAVSAAPLSSAGPVPSGTVLQTAAPALAGGFVTDARALVPFNRTIVRTVGKGAHPKLNVASADLKRPPKGSLMAPLEVLNPSSPFGYRVSPLTGSRSDFHLGQDYAARCGTRVYAADSGVVRAAGWHPWGGGNRVEIDHGNGLITTYNHLAAIAVQTGDSVQVGQVIARVGTTGWSTGCHLHFETILGGKHTNPLAWTLIPIRQLDDLADIDMVSFEARPPSAADALRWAIPVAADQTHRVLFGDDELLDPPSPDPTAPASETREATLSASPSDTSSASGNATPSPTGTATPTGTTSSGTATPTPTGTTSTTSSGTATPTPTGTTSTTSSGTATPTPTGTTSTTSSGTATPTPAGTVTPTPATASPTPTVQSETSTGTPTSTATTAPATGSPTVDPVSGETSALPTAGS